MLSAAKLRAPVADEILFKAQHMEKYYFGDPNFPVSVIHSRHVKLEKGAPKELVIRTYTQNPEIRFTENGSPFLSSTGAGGTLHGADLSKNETWDRFGHLFHLMPEVSTIEDPRMKKP